MKIILNKKEKTALKDLVTATDYGTMSEFQKSIDGVTNKFNVVRITSADNNACIDIDSDFLTDFIKESSVTVRIMWPMLHGLYNMGQNFGLSISRILEKYRKPDTCRKSEDSKFKKISENDDSSKTLDPEPAKETYLEIEANKDVVRTVYKDIIHTYSVPGEKEMTPRLFSAIKKVYGEGIALAVEAYMDNK